MKRFGGYILAFGFFSIPLMFVDLNLIVLAWVDWWGDTIGLLIRIAIMVAGYCIWKYSDE